ncbi:MAG TPA: ATP-binding protein, partial [Gemmatimonadaceae bacterium]|nr:ATP-binding protein [Gemmatimonadaceae bacterium]
QTHFDFAAVPVADVMEAARQMIAPQAAAKAIDFVVVECPPDAVVWADRAKTEQVLLNLLSNAVKFTAEGSVTLRCDVRSPKQIALSVRDTGIGIPDAELDRVFEPFVQVGRGFTQPNEGTGLGLAISRDLARGMGGDITATSKVGKGSTFTLLLPRPTEENATAAA